MSDEQQTVEQPGPNDQGGQSGTFTPPASQDEFNRIIADRLSRERAKFADYDDLKTKATELATLQAAQLTESEKAAQRTADLEAKVKGYETKEQVAKWKAEVAQATGVPAAALSGSTLEDIQAHAEVLKPLITTPPAERGPLVTTEGTGKPGDRVAQLAQTDLASMTPEQINEARRAGRLNRLLGISS